MAISSDRHRFETAAELRPHHLMDGLLARTVHGRNLTLAVVDLRAGLRMPEHRHPQEQLGMVLRGELDITVAGDTLRRLPGDLWVIPGGVPHSVVVGPEGCSVVEAFSPPRDDWEGLARLDPSPGDWPEPRA